LARRAARMCRIRRNVRMLDVMAVGTVTGVASTPCCGTGADEAVSAAGRIMKGSAGTASKACESSGAKRPPLALGVADVV
jgi:hypothetical protein